jgi:hypothetical protein
VPLVPEPSRRGLPRRLPRRWGIALFVILGLFAYRWLGNRPGPHEPQPQPPFTVTYPGAPATVPGPAPERLAAAAARDQAEDERAGGHTLERHVGRSDADLARRLERERSINAASTFADRATAERVVGAALEREKRRIASWLDRGKGDLALEFRGDPGATVGRVLLRGDAAPRTATDARVVLRRHGDSYYVLTAYPLE